MRCRRLFVLSIFACLAGVCHAEGACPWINKATALGALGTSEGSPMASTEVGTVACHFTYQDGNITRELRIRVETAQEPEQTWKARKSQCGTRGMVLRAIGNEAVMCSTGRNEMGEEVIGRVRENVFTIIMSTSAENDPEMPREKLTEKIRLVAEQVSGNLF
jgi:hypothetical protein